MATRHKDFFVLNTSQFVNSTLNNNAVIGAVNEFVQAHGRNFVEVSNLSQTGLEPARVS